MESNLFFLKAFKWNIRMKPFHYTKRKKKQTTVIAVRNLDPTCQKPDESHSDEDCNAVHARLSLSKQI